MDGVIFRVSNFWMEAHKAFGTLEEGRELTSKYLMTDYAKLVEEVVARLWAGKDARPYTTLVESIEYFDGVIDTFKELKEKGYTTALITCGPKELVDRLIKDLKKEHVAIDHVFCNTLNISARTVKGTFDWPVAEGRMKKVEILKKICAEERIELSDVTGVADGKTDFEMLNVCGKAIGFCPTSEKIEEVADVIIEKDDLREVLKHV